jgi:hypothetical protein
VLIPDDSALNNCIPPIPKKGKIATVKTIIPIPPIQWVILLQNNIPFGTISISVNIEAPVVENPDIVSKKASVNDGIELLIIKGSVPKNDITIHEKDTIT